MSLVEHLEKLRHFQKLSNYRSINEAAKATGMSQAGLSKSISSLENVLDATLFIRSNEGLVLTKEGELILKATKNILDEATRAEAGLRSIHAFNTPERIRVGMYDSIAVYFFEDLIKYLNIIYPDVRIEMHVDKSSNLAKLVDGGDLDLAIGVNLKSQNEVRSKFYLLFEDHYSFYTSPKIEKENLNSYILHPLATDERGDSLEQILKKQIKSNLVHRVYNFETIKTLILKGLGVGVLPTQVAKPLLNQKQIIVKNLPKMPHLFGKHNIGFLAASSFIKTHEDFAKDIIRLGERWAQVK